MSIKTTSNKLQPYILNFSKKFDLPEELIKKIKNKYIRETLDLNISASSGNIYCTDYNAWINFYPSGGNFNVRLFNSLNGNRELFYVNKKIIEISINKKFYTQHGFSNKEDENEA